MENAKKPGRDFARRSLHRLGEHGAAQTHGLALGARERATMTRWSADVISERAVER